MKSLINSFKYAFEGILTALKTERNMKIHFGFVGAVILCGIVFKMTKLEWMLCCICFALVISAEMFNTAIEALVDLASPEIHPLAKKAKDVAAGATLVTAIFAAIVGLLIFVPKVF